MICSKCGSAETEVLETRAAGPQEIRRRRHCLTCKKRWTTVEQEFGKEGLYLSPEKHARMRALLDELLPLLRLSATGPGAMPGNTSKETGYTDYGHNKGTRPVIPRRLVE